MVHIFFCFLKLNDFASRQYTHHFQTACSILRIYERGVLDKIQERMLPTMPRCAASAAFHSARLADVYSAFFLLVAGMLTAISIGIVERIWNKRRQMHETIVRSIRQHHLIPHIHFHHNHHHDRANDQPRRNAAPPTGGLRYDPPYLTILQDHARQVQSFVGLQDQDALPPEKSRGAEPRFQVRRRSAGLKRTSWVSFSGLSKKKMRATEKITPSSNAEINRVFPFHD